MAITRFTASLIGFGQYRLDWTSDSVDPTYYLYRDGLLILSGQGITSYVVNIAPGTAPVFEVLDSAADPTPGYPQTVVLAWYAVAGTHHYEVQQYIATVWTTVATIADAGQPYFRWESAALADDTTHQFRVRAIGTNGNTGTAATFSCLMVRVPDPPDVSYSYNAGTGAVTVSAN